LNIPAAHLPLDTHLALSQLRIVLGSKREQLIMLDHHQRLSKRMSGFLSYNNIVSPGFLLNSLSRYRRLNLNLDFTSKHVYSVLEVGFLKIAVDENGGVKPNQNVDGLSKSDYEQLSTFLPDENREIRRSFVNLKNDVLLFKSGSESDSTSITKLKVYGIGSYLKFGTRYTGKSDSLYYQNEFLSVDATADTAGYDVFSFHPGLAFSFENRNVKAIVKSGWSKYYLSSRINTLEATVEYSVVNFYANLSSENGSLDLKWDRVTSNFNTDGDVSLLANASYQINTLIFSNVNVSGGTAALAPEATAEFYVSNHFIWNNNFKKEKFAWVKPSVGFLNNRFTLFTQLTQIENYIYFNDRALPEQGNEKVEVLAAGLKMDVLIRHWRFVGEVRSMDANKGYIRLPEWGAYGRFSYRSRFFKKALLAEFGVLIASTAEWKGYAFMPATGAQYLQSDRLVGGSPSVDVFFNADLGRASLTLMMQRINNKWFGKENYVAPGYPAPPTTFKFGVFWKLYN
jgi:Putative porin